MEQAEQPTTQQKRDPRSTSSNRFEQRIVLVTLVGLALTGLPQEYGSQPWAQFLIRLLGGVESVRILHRFLATLLIAEAVYHGGVIAYKVYVLGRRAALMPGLRDVRDALHWIAFNLGLYKESPHVALYDFGRRVEYLAALWGTVIMIITGFVLWNRISTATILPGEVIPAARTVHGAQAVLLIWRIYTLLVKRADNRLASGKLAGEGVGVSVIEQGERPVELPAPVIERRKKRFRPFAIAMVALLTSGLIWFFTLESTAINTVPRREVAVFVPQLSLDSGDAAVGETLWPNLRCARCHGESASGPDAPSLRNLDLSFDEFYQQVREGVPDRMPAFGSGEIPDTYLLHIWTWLRQSTDAP
jgi:cytochrome b subunit of formate dehydrogenase